MNNIRSKTDIHNSFNTLACLIQGLKGHYTVVDLRDDTTVVGKIDEVDGSMNILLDDVVLQDTYGRKYGFPMMFIRERHIRYIHIPQNVNISDAINKGMSSNIRTRPEKTGKLTFKEKRAKMKQKETLKLLKTD